MSKLTLWSGGVKVYPPAPPEPTPENPVPTQDKFSTCELRSAEEITRDIKTCCSTRRKTGYVCNKFDTFPLTPEVCAACLHYSPKPAA